MKRGFTFLGVLAVFALVPAFAQLGSLRAVTWALRLGMESSG